MVRRQVNFTEDQHRWLKETAADQGISVAEVVRRAIDEAIQERHKPNIEELRRRALAAMGCGHSGESDVSKRHDDYLADAYMDRKEDQ